MADVTISRVEALPLRAATVQERTDSSQDALVVRIVADDDTVGIGEVDSSPHMVKAVIEAPYSHTMATGLGLLLEGRDPFAILPLREAMLRATSFLCRSGVVAHAMAGIDLALWDLVGKLVGKPVYALLGGAAQDLRVYASHTLSFDVEENAARAARAVDEGYTAMTRATPR